MIHKLFPISSDILLLCQLVPLSIFSQPFPHSISLSPFLSLSPRPQPSALCALTCAWAPMRSPVEVIVCYHSGFNMLSAHCTYLFSCLQTHCACVCVCNRERERPKKEVGPLLFSYIMVWTVFLSLPLSVSSLSAPDAQHTPMPPRYIALCTTVCLLTRLFSVLLVLIASVSSCFISMQEAHIRSLSLFLNFNLLYLHDMQIYACFQSRPTSHY